MDGGKWDAACGHLQVSQRAGRDKTYTKGITVPGCVIGVVANSNRGFVRDIELQVGPSFSDACGGRDSHGKQANCFHEPVFQG